jgi:hypothetical protein
VTGRRPWARRAHDELRAVVRELRGDVPRDGIEPKRDLGEVPRAELEGFDITTFFGVEPPREGLECVRDVRLACLGLLREEGHLDRQRHALLGDGVDRLACAPRAEGLGVEGEALPLGVDEHHHHGRGAARLGPTARRGAEDRHEPQREGPSPQHARRGAPRREGRANGGFRFFSVHVRPKPRHLRLLRLEV